jgi:hypothetical protein
VPKDKLTPTMRAALLDAYRSRGEVRGSVPWTVKKALWSHGLVDWPDFTNTLLITHRGRQLAVELDQETLNSLFE